MDPGELTTFLLAFAVALLGAKLFGELAERIGQPAVLGELAVGVLLGPSLLGLVPLTAGILLVAEIGVLLLLFEVGLETDLEELLRVGAPAVVLAVVSQLVATGSVGVGTALRAAGLSFLFLLGALVIGLPLGRLLVRFVRGARVRGVLAAVAVA